MRNNTESFEEVVEQAIAKWESQGRTDEQKWAVRNFFTGAGLAILAAHQATIDQRVAEELHRLRSLYDDMELKDERDSMEGSRPYVTWRGWKMVRNPITDRIEELTGRRDWPGTVTKGDQPNE